jgi:hypothetical protein
MQTHSNAMAGDKDPELWEVAKKRAGFKSHLLTYIVMVIVFWLIWWFTGARITGDLGLPWPVWPTAGWGIGVFFHYLGAYVFRQNQVQREYEKLVNERKEL